MKLLSYPVLTSTPQPTNSLYTPLNHSLNPRPQRIIRTLDVQILQPDLGHKLIKLDLHPRNRYTQIMQSLQLRLVIRRQLVVWRDGRRKRGDVGDRLRGGVGGRGIHGIWVNGGGGGGSPVCGGGCGAVAGQGDGADGFFAELGFEEEEEAG